MVSEVKQGSSTSRFSNRAENYVKFRPGYPQEVFDLLTRQIVLRSSADIADIGSGTGLFAEPLLKMGFNVFCVEPNDEMRKAGEQQLSRYPGFTSLPRKAEQTGLDAGSIDLVTIAQTFHWLDPQLTKEECLRILRPGGHVMLAWNKQKTDSAFEKDYTALRERYRIGEPGSKQIDLNRIMAFFAPGQYEESRFPNVQLLTFESLKGQLLSKSYIPLPGYDSYEKMIEELIQLFVKYNENGHVRLEYETVVYRGSLS